MRWLLLYQVPNYWMRPQTRTAGNSSMNMATPQAVGKRSPLYKYYCCHQKLKLMHLFRRLYSNRQTQQLNLLPGQKWAPLFWSEYSIQGLDPLKPLRQFG